MANKTYSEKEIQSLVEGANVLKGDTHTLPLDHDRRLGVYDVESAKAALETDEQRDLLEDLLAGYSVNDVANKYGVSEKTIKRRFKDIASQMKKQLNGEDITMEKVTIIKEKKGVATVIEFGGLRYILNNKDTYQPKEKKKK